MDTISRLGVRRACFLVVWVLARYSIAEQAEGPTYSSSSGSSSSVSWFVQLSDLHINKWTHHDIVPDLAAFGQQVLASTRPAAVLLTGDLVDAKTRPEGSQQHKEEWQAYEQSWQQLAQAAQLAPSAILDLRGNHDVFDTLRNSREDFFALYSATAAAHGQDAAAVQRVWVRPLLPQLLLQQPGTQQQQQYKRKHRNGDHSGERRRLLHSNSNDGSYSVNTNSSSSTGGGLVSVSLQGSLSQGPTAAAAVAAAAPVRTALSAANSGPDQPAAAAARELHTTAAAAAEGTSCPAAVLLGLDFTPNLGLHSPANFFGVAGPALLQELQRQLQQLRSSSSSRNPSASSLTPCSRHVPIISYSHYPFSTVASVYGSSSSSRGGGGTAVQGGRAVRDLLRRYDVSAHLSGHLHDLLGPRMQALYRKQGSNTYLADWEAADWKHRRRWRLLAVDSGVTSFADLHFRHNHCSIAAAAAGACHAGSSSSSSGVGSSSSSDGYWYEVSSVDSSRVVSQHVVMLTWPPDARYSPLTAVQPGSSSSGSEELQTDDSAQPKVEGGKHSGSTSGNEDVLPVRVLVVPLQLRGSTSAKQLAGVTLEWFCQGSASDLAAGLSTKGKTLGSTTMHPVGTPVAEGLSEGGSTKTFRRSPDSQGDFPYELTEPQVFAAAVPLNPSVLARQCGGSSSSSNNGLLLLLQVTVKDSSRGVSTSELRPVLAAQFLSSSSSSSTSRDVEQQQQQQQQQHSAAAAGHLPLPSSIAEQTLLTFDGQRFSVQLFMAGWLTQFVGLLLLPRLLAHHILAASARLDSSSSSTGRLLRHQQSLQQYQLQEQYKRSFSLQCRPTGPLDIVKAVLFLLHMVLRAMAVQCAKLLLLPFVSMAVLAQQHVRVWWAVLGHCMWVLVGPWFCAQMSSSSKGLGLWFRYGMFLPLPGDLATSWVNGDAGSPFYDGDVNNNVITGEEHNIDVDNTWQEYVWIGIPDTHLISSLTACLILAPLTLWLGLVVRHWHAVAAAARRSGAGSSSVATAAAAAVVSDSGTGVAAGYSTADSRVELAGIETVCPDGIELQQQQGSASSSSSKDVSAAAAAAAEDVDATCAVKSPLRLGRTRSHPAARRRDSNELAQHVAAAAAAMDVAGSNSPRISRSSSGSCDVRSTGLQAGAECSSSSDVAAATEEEKLLLPPAAAAAAVGASAWWAKLLPTSTLTSSSSDNSSSSSSDNTSNSFSHRLLSPRYLACCVLYVLLLAVRPTWRALQLCLVSVRIPLPLLLLAAPVWAFWYKVCWRLAAAYGPVALVVNPVIGWLPLFMVLALRSVRHELAAGKARRREE